MNKNMCFIFINIKINIPVDYSLKYIDSRDTNAKSNCCLNDTCELIRLELMVFLG